MEEIQQFREKDEIRYNADTQLAVPRRRWANYILLNMYVDCSVMSYFLQPQAPLSMGFSRKEYWSG